MAIFNSYVSLPEGKSWGKTNALGEKNTPTRIWSNELGGFWAIGRLMTLSTMEMKKDIPIESVFYGNQTWQPKFPPSIDDFPIDTSLHMGFPIATLREGICGACGGLEIGANSWGSKCGKEYAAPDLHD